MNRCKNCGAYLDPGEICDCVRSQEERAAMKEAMLITQEYLDTLEKIASDNNAVITLKKALKIVLTEVARKYSFDPKEFLEEILDTIADEEQI